LKLAMGVYERFDRTVSTAEIHAEIADRLREELDYRREAAHMRLYGEILKNEPGVAVPRPLAELSTGRLLTMTWLDGAPILNFAATAPLAVRNEIALRMFRIWYVPFYYYGVIHGDPHLGVHGPLQRPLGALHPDRPIGDLHLHPRRDRNRQPAYPRHLRIPPAPTRRSTGPRRRRRSCGRLGRS
jgi:hypothetical protein